MQASLVTTEAARSTLKRIDTIVPSATPAPVAPAINTILAVREHAPAEIEELTLQIQGLHNRLGAAYARKHLLEQLLSVIQESDDSRPAGMSIVR